MKKTAATLFDAIRNDDLEQVIACVETEPACVNAVAPKKPLDTKGMSPLQVALTTGWHRKIAWYLLEHGADVNFMEPPELRKIQAEPVFFDVVQVAIRNARRWELNEETDEYRLMHAKEDADEAFAFLKAVVERGADLKATDHYNNVVMTRALYAACCVYPDPRYRGFRHSEEQDEDLLRIFRYLVEQGAELQPKPWGYKKTVMEIYRETVWPLVGGLFE